MFTYTIQRNETYNSLEIYFNHKPAEKVLEIMHDLKFRWNFKKSCWYGFADENAVTAKLNAAETENKPELVTGGVYGDGYMGGGEWTGCNSGYKSYSEINKIVKKEMQRRFPGVKFAARGKSFSGGQSSDFYVCLPAAELFDDPEICRERWEDDIWHSYWLYLPDGSSVPVSCSTEEQRNAAYEKEYNGVISSHCLPHSLFVSEKAQSIMQAAKELYRSFIHDETNSMVDYFDRSLYDSYHFINLDAPQKSWDVV